MAKQADVRIRVYVDPERCTAFVVRTIGAGREMVMHFLSRKTGQFIPCTQQQIRKRDIPAECLFSADNLPGPGKIPGIRK